MDINIAFSRSLLQVVVRDVRKYVPGIKVSRAAVLDSGFGQWLFEYMDEGVRYCTYVRADNAYEARAKGWQAWIRSKGFEGEDDT